MSILIEGMEMPKDDMKNIMILADGRVFQFSGYGNPKPLGTAVPVPPHGRLIDADAFVRKIDEEVAKFVAINEYDSGLRTGYRASKETIQLLPTVIPASEEEKCV